MNSQQPLTQRFCSVLFALLLALGPVVGSYAHSNTPVQKVNISPIVSENICADTDTSSSEESENDNKTIVKQTQVFHAVITGHLQLNAPCTAPKYESVAKPSIQESIYPSATLDHTTALMVYHQTLRHHFIAPQAP